MARQGMTGDHGVRSVVCGVGAFLPEKILTNDDLAAMIDTSDAWIRQRTGIARRHIAADHETTSDLACRAAERALANAGVAADAVDGIIVATTTPDNTFPATAARVQAKLGISRGPAFDIQAVCSGFVYALNQADNMLRLGQASTVLVIGAEIYSRILDWQDRSTCVLFGDGAGAVLLRAQPDRDGGKGDDSVHDTADDTAAAGVTRGILSHHIACDGRHYDLLCVDGGPGMGDGRVGHVRMQGGEVFRHAVRCMADSVHRVLADAGLTLDDLDWLVPHQANLRIIESVGRKLSMDRARILVTVEEHANTSAATIPLALTHGVERQLFRPGDLIACTAMGGGFAWGATLLRW